MNELYNITSDVLNIVLQKEFDYYTFYLNEIIKEKNVFYSSNTLAYNLLHIDFQNYMIEEIKSVVDCATKWINYIITLLENKYLFSKEEINGLDYASIQLIGIYSNILDDFYSEQEYQNFLNLRHYYETDYNKVLKHLERNYNNSQLIKLIYVYVLIQDDKINQAKKIYDRYVKIDNKHPFYGLGIQLEKKINNDLK